MSAQILLAPVGAGKTEQVLARLTQTLQAEPFARVWLLVSGKRQEDAFRQRLIESSAGRHVYVNVEFFTAYELFHRLLSLAGQPPRMLDDTARFGLLRAVIDDLCEADQLQVFGTIANTPGFLRVVADFIYELKQNLVEDTHYQAVAQTAKDRELALIYRTYQQQLRKHELVDREGEGWLALTVLEQPDFAHIGREVDLLLVDGFDHFTTLQANLLMLIAARAREALITLSTVPGREDTVGRRFADALAQLQHYRRAPVEIIEGPAQLDNFRHIILQHMMDSLFLRSAQPLPGGEAVSLIEAPDQTRESAAVLRRVKQLLLSGAAQADDILIALRDWPHYAGPLHSLGHEYGLPLALHEGLPLSQNPAVVALLNLLHLPAAHFRRRELLDVLRSPYIDAPGLGPPQVALLTTISERFLVTGGRQNWLDAVARAPQPAPAATEDESDEAPLLDADSQRQLQATLSGFFDAITPPEHGPMRDYVRWLSDLIGPDFDQDPEDPALDVAAYHLNIPAQLAKANSVEIENRDRSALVEFIYILRSLLSADALLTALDTSPSSSAEHFLRQLRIAVDQAQVNRHPTRSGRVLVTTVTNARGLPHQHVFVMGLSEGIFPAPQPEDPLYLDSERADLSEAGVHLATLAERSADGGLFYEMIGLARETLTLSRPTVQDGAPWIASHLWRAVSAVLNDADSSVQTIRPGDIASLDDAASMQEFMLALADGLSQPQPSDSAAAARSWLLHTAGDHWRRIEAARQMELRRMTNLYHHDQYTGRLHDPSLVAQAAALLGPERLWSASQLNDYGYCGFRFFAKRLLGLEALETPETGLDAARLGTINHAILEATYREIGQRGLEIAPGNLAAALAIMEDVAGPILEAAPQEHGFATDALWAQEQAILKRHVEALLHLDFSGDGPVSKLLSGPRRPLLLEALFSDDVRVPVQIDGRDEELRVKGFIDRIDQIGDQALVIDYKTGSTAIPTSEMREGRNFQMMLYLYAARQMLDSQPSIAGGLFWHIRSQKASGQILLNDEGVADIETALAHVGHYIATGRRGDFTVQPRKLDRGRCVHYCDFAQLCRTASTNPHKPEPEL